MHLVIVFWSPVIMWSYIYPIPLERYHQKALTPPYWQLTSAEIRFRDCCIPVWPAVVPFGNGWTDPNLCFEEILGWDIGLFFLCKLVTIFLLKKLDPALSFSWCWQRDPGTSSFSISRSLAKWIWSPTCQELPFPPAQECQFHSWRP